jgi:ankyrin repeat protein
LLIRNGASVNALTTDNQTPLHWAAQRGNTKTAELLIEKEVGLMAEKGASVNSLTTDNHALLHWALQSGSSETVAIITEECSIC